MDLAFILILVTMLVTFVLSFAKGKFPLRLLFYFWIFSFNIGPRAVYPGGCIVYFVEGITWFLFFIYLMRANFYLGYKNLLPKFTFLCMTTWLIGIGIAMVENYSLLVIVRTVQPFLCLVPSFYITYYAFKYLGVSLKTVIKLFVIGALILAVGGVATYFFPSLLGSFGGGGKGADSVLLDTDSIDVALGDETMIRGGKSFWGLLIIAAYLGLLAFPIGIAGMLNRSVVNRTLAISAVVLVGIEIVIAAHRSVWVGVLAALAFYAYQRGAKGVFGTGLLAALVFAFLPHNVFLRFASVVNTAAWAGREVRYERALGVIKDNLLLGGGRGPAGWPHNFVLQLGADIGLLGLGAFLLWLGTICASALASLKARDFSDVSKTYVLSFLAAIIMYLGPMLAESVITYPFLTIPLWFFCALLHNVIIGNFDLTDDRYWK